MMKESGMSNLHKYRRVKRFSLCLLITFPFFFCSVCSNLYALEPGEWLNDVTMEVETPHLEWAKNIEGGPLKILFVTTGGAALHFQKPILGARLIVEWAQRMDIEYEAVTGGRGCAKDKENPRLTFDLFHPIGYDGIQPQEKERELAEKLEKNYDLFVFNHISFDAISPEAQKVILKAVVCGSGLVLIGDTQTRLDKLFKHPDPKLVRDIMRLDYFPHASLRLKQTEKKPEEYWKKDSSPLRAYKLGKGRIVRLLRNCDPANGVVYFMPEWLSKYKKLPESEQRRISYYNEAPIPIWWGEFENLNASFLRLFYYASGRKPLVAMSCPELSDTPSFNYDKRTIKLDLNNSGRKGRIAWRIRNDENKVVFKGKKAFDGNKLELNIPVLPAGIYNLDLFCHVDGKLVDFGIQRFNVVSPITASIEMNDDRVKDGEPIEFTLALSEGIKDGVTLVSLADSPYDRVWFKKEYPLGGNKRITIKIENWFLPNAAATLRIEVTRGGDVIAYARKTLFRPEGNRLPPWPDMAWGEALTPLHILANQAAQGWNGTTRAISGSWGTSIQNFMVTGEICMPWAPLTNWYIMNNRHKRSVGYTLDPKTKETCPDWTRAAGGALTYGATKEDVEKLTNMPNGMEHRLDSVREVLRIWEKSIRPFDYGTPLFNLGDETKPGYDTFTGKFAEKEFHRFLSRKFETIEKLNEAWRRSYRSFDEIPLLTTKEAIKKNLAPEGAAQREFADKNYFDVYQTIGETIRKKAPSAHYGSNSSAMIEEVNYPDLTASFAHPETGMMELWRTMRPDALYIPLYGYEIKHNAFSNKKVWESAISGAGSGNMFFALNTYPEGGTTCVDRRDKMPNHTKARLMMKDGLGALLETMKVDNGTMAVLASSPSTKAEILLQDFVPSSKLSSEPLFQYGKENGIVIDHFTIDALEGYLSRYNALFLFGVSAISKADAEKIVAFVKNGGTVVADLNPGVYNEHLAPYEHYPLKDLFGELKPSKINGENDFDGIKVKGVKEIPPMTERKVGKGQAILFNFSLSQLREAMGDSEKFDAFMRRFMERIEAKSPLKIGGLPKNSIIRLRHKDEFDLLAFANDGMASIGKGSGDVTVSFPKKGYIYRIGQGFLRKGDTVTVPFDPPFVFLTRFDKKQSPPEIILDSQETSLGKTIHLDISVFEKGRVMTAKLFDPSGKLIRPRNESHVHELIVIDGKEQRFPIHFSYDDLPGEYELVLTDVATGLSSKKKINLR